MPRKEIVRGWVSILAGLAIWELLAWLLLENELLIPPPSSVARTFWKLTVTGQLNKHLAATLIEFAYGFTTACIVGVAWLFYGHVQLENILWKEIEAEVNAAGGFGRM